MRAGRLVEEEWAKQPDCGERFGINSPVRSHCLTLAGFSLLISGYGYRYEEIGDQRREMTR